jgi:hypothetical protein
MTYAAELRPDTAARSAIGASTLLGTKRAPRSIGIPVGLHFGDGACASGVATSITGNGMFVATAMEPTRSGCVDVRLIPRCGCGGGAHSIRLPSLIMYRNGDGIGLLFRHLDPRAEEMVRCLIEDCAA